MAELTTLARPYAKAAFEFAQGVNALERWSNMLTTVSTVVIQPAVEQFLSSPGITAEAKANKVVDICGDDIDNKVANFVHCLAHNKRLLLLPQIFQLFETLKDQKEEQVFVELVSAQEIDAQSEQTLADALSKKLSRQVNIKSSVDPELMAGVIIKAGDLIIDGSMRGRFEKLARAINS
ncbi:F0F1 ATP synthase subunit delta [Aurantivibrio plasticivorans]